MPTSPWAGRGCGHPLASRKLPTTGARPSRSGTPTYRARTRPSREHHPSTTGQHPLCFPTASASTEWRDLLDKLVSSFDPTVDQAGSTFGFDYWIEQVALGSAPPSLLGEAMQLPASLPLTSVPSISQTPMFWWWAMWRRRLPADSVTQFSSALHTSIADIEPEQSARTLDATTRPVPPPVRPTTRAKSQVTIDHWDLAGVINDEITRKVQPGCRGAGRGPSALLAELRLPGARRARRRPA